MWYLIYVHSNPMDTGHPIIWSLDKISLPTFALFVGRKRTDISKVFLLFMEKTITRQSPI